MATLLSVPQETGESKPTERRKMHGGNGRNPPFNPDQAGPENIKDQGRPRVRRTTRKSVVLRSNQAFTSTIPQPNAPVPMEATLPRLEIAPTAEQYKKFLNEAGKLYANRWWYG
ncbi:hypothetical protein K1719_000072 [Acacia pycnantha]|nr:hypothetical protein K1719_000072 [Acacia pycnantha]